MVKTVTKGIFPSDILIRTAMVEGVLQLRKAPWLLDYVFAWLMSDDLTQQQYGAAELEEARKWFLNNDISVVMAYRTDKPDFPCIGIELVESNEGGANSLGDVSNEGPTERIETSDLSPQPVSVLGPFTPKTYDSTTGLVTLPDDFSTDNLFAGNVLFDSITNKGYTIQDVIDRHTFRIDAGVNANFTKAVVASSNPQYVVHLESVEFQETYRVRCFVNTTPVHLLFLWSVALFILLRNKQDLLEARGFERTTLRALGITVNDGQDNPERIWMRDILISGYVRQYWPKTAESQIDGIAVNEMKVLDGGTSPAQIAQEVQDQGWMMEFDQFGNPTK
jgi:hypothetical protein